MDVEDRPRDVSHGIESVQAHAGAAAASADPLEQFWDVGGRRLDVDEDVEAVQRGRQEIQLLRAKDDSQTGRARRGNSGWGNPLTRGGQRRRGRQRQSQDGPRECTHVECDRTTAYNDAFVVIDIRRRSSRGAGLTCA